MPVVEISLLKGRSIEEIALICETIHRAVVKHYEIPEGDRFQLVRQYEPYELRFDRDFAGGPRSDRFVLVQITSGRERPVATKQSLFEEIATSLRQQTGLDPEDVLIMLGNVKMTDLSLAGGRPYGV